MTLPVPNLDDRRFQDIVDEAKRLIPRHCPEWTDHNLSDPGIALVELFAWMTEMTLYRLNQVPDKHYVKFLELMGVRLFPAASARVDVAFWLSGPQPEAVRIHAKTQVGTVRTEQEESVVFMTDDDLVVVVPRLSRCLTQTADGRYEDHWDELRIPGELVTCFPGPAAGAAAYFGFEESLAGNIVSLDFTVQRNAGKGIDPQRPPWAWEVWSGGEWVPARVHRDETGGLNVDGAVVLMIPSQHEALTVGPHWAFWVRCRVVETPGAHLYEASPQVGSLAARSRGGVTAAHHANLAPREAVGRSDGTAGQTFVVRRTPVLARYPEETVEVTGSGGLERWTEVEDFAASGPEDRHFVWDGSSGEISFGPRIAYPDGQVRDHGAVPPVDAQIVVTGYRYGGGSRGNVGSGTLSVLKSSIPFVGRVENLAPAQGGVDPETVDNAKQRGPMSLRTGQRAVTAQDFERLTLEASPLVARARCVPPEVPGGPVRVLIIPRVDIPPERLRLDDLRLPEELTTQVGRYLDDRRILTTTVQIDPPHYQGLTIVARVKGAGAGEQDLLRDRLLSVVYRYINPLVGGPEGAGWPFGRELNVGEVFALLSGVDGVVGVEDVRLYLADLLTGERQEGRQRARLSEGAVFASFQHQVQVR